MTPTEAGDITVEACFSCGGLWFEQGELGRLVNRYPGEAQELDKRVAAQPEASPKLLRICPRCLCGMTGFDYAAASVVHLNSCPQCNGVFIEDGELGAIVQRKQAAQARAEANTEAQAAKRAAVAGLEARIGQNKALAAVFRRASER
ncbi:MAG: zf-TFIIB domain-containing protein [Fimbriimonadaceae bacterium]|nr:zf-TFIIB domain-containing protein [Fimbriimonadaceae bacterium]QYK59728.1 MAG: zf-TFIIB domain-containing protein [Fimbriimonadaceae bacterium]